MQVSRTESTRSSSTSGNYFGAPFSYAGDLRRSTVSNANLYDLYPYYAHSIVV